MNVAGRQQLSQPRMYPASDKYMMKFSAATRLPKRTLVAAILFHLQQQPSTTDGRAALSTSNRTAMGAYRNSLSVVLVLFVVSMYSL